MLRYRDVEKQDCDWCSKYQFSFTVVHLRLLNYITGRVSWFMGPYGMIIPAVAALCGRKSDESATYPHSSQK